MGRCNPLSDLTLSVVLFRLRKFDENFLHWLGCILVLEGKAHLTDLPPPQ